MDFLYQQFVAGKQKAVAAFVAGTVVVFLAKHGVVLPQELKDIVEPMVYALLVMIPVYLKRNRA